MKKICFATHNNNKAQEIQDLLGGKYEVVSLKDLNFDQDIPEPFETLEENSLIKAQTIFNKHTIPVFADDTGLFVEALNGAPGVYSARYAGEDGNAEKNISKLLKELTEVKNRKAYFKTIVSYINENGEIQQFEGKVEGSITEGYKGNKGFGYDPIFVPNNFSITFAEMGGEEKNKISHRGIAVRKLIEHLNKI